jgi:hypothetical protein
VQLDNLWFFVGLGVTIWCALLTGRLLLAAVLPAILLSAVGGHEVNLAVTGLALAAVFGWAWKKTPENVLAPMGLALLLTSALMWPLLLNVLDPKTALAETDLLLACVFLLAWRIGARQYVAPAVAALFLASLLIWPIFLFDPAWNVLSNGNVPYIMRISLTGSARVPSIVWFTMIGIAVVVCLPYTWVRLTVDRQRHQ